MTPSIQKTNLPCWIWKQPKRQKNWKNCNARKRSRKNSGRVLKKRKDLMTDSTDLQPLSEAERLARSKQREQGALAELQKALAEARLNGQKNTEGVTDMAENGDNAGNGHTAMKGKIEVNENEVNRIDDNATSSTVVKLVKKPSDYFHTLAENEPEPKLIKSHHRRGYQGGGRVEGKASAAG